MADRPRPRRTSDFQGTRRAQQGAGHAGKGQPGGHGKIGKRKLNVNIPAGTRDISAILKALRERKKD